MGNTKSDATAKAAPSTVKPSPMFHVPAGKPKVFVACKNGNFVTTLKDRGSAEAWLRKQAAMPAAIVKETKSGLRITDLPHFAVKESEIIAI